MDCAAKLNDTKSKIDLEAQETVKSRLAETDNHCTHPKITSVRPKIQPLCKENSKDNVDSDHD